jgi:adenylylsulfate kinase-like enzyme
VYLCTPLAVCEGRDPKGHYARARRGEIPEFTGVSAVYETPENPGLTLDTSLHGVEKCVDALLAAIDAANGRR